MRAPVSPRPDPRRTHALARYARGEISYEIAASLGVHQITVARWLAQVTTLRRTGPRGRTDVPDRLIVEFRDLERLSFTAIAAQTRMSKTGVINRYRVATEGRRRDR